MNLRTFLSKLDVNVFTNIDIVVCEITDYGIESIATAIDAVEYHDLEYQFNGVNEKLINWDLVHIERSSAYHFRLWVTEPSVKSKKWTIERILDQCSKDFTVTAINTISIDVEVFYVNPTIEILRDLFNLPQITIEQIKIENYAICIKYIEEVSKS